MRYTIFAQQTCVEDSTALHHMKCCVVCANRDTTDSHEEPQGVWMRARRNTDGLKCHMSVLQEHLTYGHNHNARLWDQTGKLQDGLEVRQAGLTHIHNIFPTLMK